MKAMERQAILRIRRLNFDSIAQIVEGWALLRWRPSVELVDRVGVRLCTLVGGGKKSQTEDYQGGRNVGGFITMSILERILRGYGALGIDPPKQFMQQVRVFHQTSAHTPSSTECLDTELGLGQQIPKP